MMMMTAKVNFKKVVLGLVAAAAVIIALVLMLGKEESPQPAAVSTMTNNDSRVQFLREQGWQVTTSPKESGQVRIPQELTPVYSRYNTLQQSQGFDLSKYAGKTVMRYVYEVNNYPGATQPVYATLLVYKDEIIGGDVTDTAAKGAIRGVKQSPQDSPSESPATTQDSTAASE